MNAAQGTVFEYGGLSIVEPGLNYQVGIRVTGPLVHALAQV